jgi:hypothetical protein
MSAPDPVAVEPVASPAAVRLVEAVMSASAGLARAGTPLTPPGVPVRSGRVHLGRLRPRVPAGGPVTVVAGFATVCWLGGPDASPPDLGRMVYRAETTPDRRGRVVLDRRARAWLAVATPGEFEAVVMAAPSGGVLVVPVEDYARRAEAVTTP